jgi:hypothetical protein
MVTLAQALELTKKSVEARAVCQIMCFIADLLAF